MEYIIKNEYLTAIISSFGAELRQLIDKDGINRLHRPESLTWNRVSPILFPQISRTPNLEYQVDGKTYHMPAHGFIRDSQLEVLKATNDSIAFYYQSNPKSFEMYPYDFLLIITYKLNKNNLEVEFEVKNTADKVLRYMLGGHPGFRVPLFDNEKYEDYKVLFEVKETCQRMCVVDGFLANQYEDFLTESNEINLNHNLFIEDALVFRGLESTYVDIVSKNHNKKIRFHFNDFEILALWSKPKDNMHFLCLEPWNGIQKNFVPNHELMKVFELKAYEDKKYSYVIEVIN